MFYKLKKYIIEKLGGHIDPIVKHNIVHISPNYIRKIEYRTFIDEDDIDDQDAIDCCKMTIASGISESLLSFIHFSIKDCTSIDGGYPGFKQMIGCIRVVEDNNQGIKEE